MQDWSNQSHLFRAKIRLGEFKAVYSSLERFLQFRHAPQFRLPVKLWQKRDM